MLRSFLYTLVLGIFLASIGLVGWIFIDQYQKNRAEKESQTYLSCGCGCCPDAEILTEICLYREKGDDIEEIIQADQKLKQSRECQTAECSKPILYKYCE